MGPPKAGRQVLRRSGSEEAVTPVVGSVLILGITVLGIAGVLFWGAPMIDRMQARNAQAAMVGEFEDLRTSSRELSVPDHSRFPTVVISRGELSLVQGSRFLLTVDFEEDCDFRVTGWSTGAVATSTSGCPAGATVNDFSVSGSTIIDTTYSAADPTSDWLWVLSHASCPDNEALGEPDVCAVAWLHSTDRISWEVGASDEARKVHLDGGAIFSDFGGSHFLEKEPIIADTVFGNAGTQPYYGLWLRSMDAASYSAITATGSHQVYFSLIGNYVRVDQEADRLRIDVGGDLAEAWCNALMDRNGGLPDADNDGDADASYASQAADCGDIGGGIRSVCYSSVPSSPCTASSPFTLRLLHARIYTSLAL